jgi:hypothetical protein
MTVNLPFDYGQKVYHGDWYHDFYGRPKEIMMREYTVDAYLVDNHGISVRVNTELRGIALVPLRDLHATPEEARAAAELEVSGFTVDKPKDKEYLD